MQKKTSISSDVEKAHARVVATETFLAEQLEKREVTKEDLEKVTEHLRKVKEQNAS